MQNKLSLILGAVILLAVAVVMPAFSQPWEPAPGNPPSCVKADGTISQGCYPAIDHSPVPQIKQGGLGVNGLLRSLTGMLVNTNALANTTLPAGAVGAAQYCDQDGKNCTLATDLGGGGYSAVQYTDGNGATDPGFQFNSSNTNGKLWLRAGSGSGAIGFTKVTGDFDGDGVNEDALSFIGGGGQQGPVGPVGPAGPQGPAGLNGTGSGTVTSIVAGNGLMTSSGSPITSSGTINIKTCADGKILKSGTGNIWGCGDDNASSGGGDNLGNHIAGQELQMGANHISFGNNTSPDIYGSGENLIMKTNTAGKVQLSSGSSGTVIDSTSNIDISSGAALTLDAVGGIVIKNAGGTSGTLKQVLTANTNGVGVWSSPPFNPFDGKTQYTYYDRGNGMGQALGSHKMCFITGGNGFGCKLLPATTVQADSQSYNVVSGGWKIDVYGGDSSNPARCQAICF